MMDPCDRASHLESPKYSLSSLSLGQCAGRSLCLEAEQKVFVAKSQTDALSKHLRALKDGVNEEIEICHNRMENYSLELRDIAKMRKQFERFCSYEGFDAMHKCIYGEKFLNHWKKWMRKREEEVQKIRTLTVGLKIRLKNVKEDLTIKTRTRDLITATDCSALQMTNKYLADILFRKQVEFIECRKKQSAICANTLRLNHRMSELLLENAKQIRRLRSKDNAVEICNNFRERIFNESVEEEQLLMDLSYRQRTHRYPTVSAMVELAILDRQLEHKLKIESRRLATSKLRLECHRDAWRIHAARYRRIAKKNTSNRVTHPPPLLNLPKESSVTEQSQEENAQFKKRTCCTVKGREKPNNVDALLT
ncbi:unnamed protein product [Calicophoron daubneyi]